MCVCVCAGVLMVDVFGHQGIPIKGQLCIRTEFGKKREEKRKKATETDREMLVAIGDKRNS